MKKKNVVPRIIFSQEIQSISDQINCHKNSKNIHKRLQCLMCILIVIKYVNIDVMQRLKSEFKISYQLFDGT
jgi:hypothetical protein